MHGLWNFARIGWDVGATYPAAHDTIGRRKTPRYLNLYQIPVLIYTTKISKFKTGTTQNKKGGKLNHKAVSITDSTTKASFLN